MREYRGKRVDNGEWVYGWYFVNLSGFHYIKSFYKGYGKLTKPPETTQLNRTVEHRVIPETVGQFTGLKDGNGVEIYFASDLVEYTYAFAGDDGEFEETVTGTVILDLDHTNSLCVQEMRDGKKGGRYHFTAGEMRNIKVIGNIHTNPELLEGDSK